MFYLKKTELIKATDIDEVKFFFNNFPCFNNSLLVYTARCIKNKSDHYNYNKII